jgi:hypothetical protein
MSQAFPLREASPCFVFLRYDIRLDQAWLAGELGVTIDERTLSRYQLMDVPENIPGIYELGVRAAERQITREHLARPGGLDPRMAHHA